MGLKGSKATEEALQPTEVMKLVMEQMGLSESVDPSVQTSLKEQIALRTGVHLKR